MINSLRVTDYEVLASYVQASIDRNIPLLIIKGAGGTGKTHLVKEKTKQAPNLVLINGRETPADFYNKLHDNPQGLVVLDDTDGWSNNETMVSLLKQAANTEEDKIIQYNTTSAVLGERPQSFVGNHTFILILNKSTRMRDENMKALLTRAVVLEFDPAVATIIERMEPFAEDKEVFNFLKSNAFKIEFSLRLYHLCVGLKESKIDWKQYVRTVFKTRNDDKLVIEEIKHLSPYERNTEWVKRTGKSVRRLQQLLSESEKNGV